MPNNEYNIAHVRGPVQRRARPRDGPERHDPPRGYDVTAAPAARILFYGIPDDSREQGRLHLCLGRRRSRRSAIAGRALIRFGSMAQNSHDTNPTPTGTPFDPFGFGANYLGNDDDDHRRERLLRDRPGRSSTSAATIPLFDGHTTRNALSGQRRLPRRIDPDGVGRRPVRERAGLHAVGRRLEPEGRKHAQQRRPVRRSAHHRGHGCSPAAAWAASTTRCSRTP